VREDRRPGRRNIIGRNTAESNVGAGAYAGDIVVAVTINAAGFVTRASFAPLAYVVVGALGVWYLRTLRRLGPGQSWDRRRTATWFLGLAIVAFVLVGGMSGWDGNSFTVHASTDAAVGMVAPFALALGAPWLGRSVPD
jgi:cytochrome c oxidase assembly factor CtaG